MSEDITEMEKSFESALQAIFQLATGALALSITFRGEIAPDAARVKWLLSLSWVFLALVTISYIFLRLSEVAIAIKRNNRHLANRTGVAIPPSEGIPPDIMECIKQGSAWWKLMIFSFLAGIICFLCFGVINNGF